MSEHTCNPFGISCAGCRDVAQAWCDLAEALAGALRDWSDHVTTCEPCARGDSCLTYAALRCAADAALARLPAQVLTERRVLEAVAVAARHLRGSLRSPGAGGPEVIRRFATIRMDVEALEAALAALDVARSHRKRVHGVNCFKEAHWTTGEAYLHGPEDDGPYAVDGVDYCGRCHRWLDAARQNR